MQAQERPISTKQPAKSGTGSAELSIFVKLTPQSGRDRPGLALADEAAIDAHQRQDDLARGGDKCLARGISLRQRERALLETKPKRGDEHRTARCA